MTHNDILTLYQCRWARSRHRQQGKSTAQACRENKQVTSTNVSLTAQTVSTKKKAEDVLNVQQGRDAQCALTCEQCEPQ